MADETGPRRPSVALGLQAANIQAALRAFADTLTPMIDEAGEAAVLQLATHSISATLTRTDISGLIRLALKAVLASGVDRSILEHALEAVSGWLDENRSGGHARFGVIRR